eukprot:TRINITY_DN42597_c0_g1_i1.p1 TRINITY_DN42597_c0_g1~~TRINITY_DN42597_c0_g1_i1.p1  ORF type:complete len:631 (+),score=78.91 TRINITY_DN42597_c0_g1_i1:65-1894(+)
MASDIADKPRPVSDPGLPILARVESPLHYPKHLEPLLEASAANPMPVSLPPPMPGLADYQWSSHRHVAPVFGLPMTGKAHVAHELRKYIAFFQGARSRVFNINDYLGDRGDARLLNDLATFFADDAAAGSPGSCENYSDAEDIDSAANYSGGFAILCASDTVKSRKSSWSAHTKCNRRWMAKTLRSLHAHLCFIEILVDDSPEASEYKRRLAEKRGKSIDDVKQMVQEYSSEYVTIQMDGPGTEKDVPFIKLLNYSEGIVVNKMMHTFVGSRVSQFLSNMHPYKQTIFVSRHGESEYNRQKRIGGDSSLTRRGKEFARRLGEFTRYIIAGTASDLVCVTLTAEEVHKLPGYISSSSREDDALAGMFGDIHAKGDWSKYGDASGACLREGMQLVRIQPGWDTDFVDSPLTIPDIMQLIGGKLATLVFVQGDVSKAGLVPARLWTSSLVRTKETAAFVPHPQIEDSLGRPWHQMLRRAHRGLDEVYAGIYDGWTEKEIAEHDPQVVENRKKDKLGFRYPRGESYFDILARLDDVMTNLARVREPILIISHQAVLRLVMGWLTGKLRTESLKLNFPQHSAMKYTYDGGVNDVTAIEYPLGPKENFDDGQGNL